MESILIIREDIPTGPFTNCFRFRLRKKKKEKKEVIPFHLVIQQNVYLLDLRLLGNPLSRMTL